MTETQILAQLKRKYEAEMVSALIGAGFTKNVYGRALSWSELLADLVDIDGMLHDDGMYGNRELYVNNVGEAKEALKLFIKYFVETDEVKMRLCKQVKEFRW